MPLQTFGSEQGKQLASWPLFCFVCLHSINRVALPHTIVTSHADTS